MSVRELVSPPNLLTLSRIPLAAAFVLVDDPRLRLGIVALASLTDMLDGWIARQFGWKSNIGQLLDPVADKTFVLAAVSTFLFEGTLTVPQFFIVLSRDFATAIGFLVAWRLPGLDPGRFKARWPGKVVTVLQIAVLITLLLAPAYLWWLVALTGIVSAIAIADYTWMLHRTRERHL